MRSSRRGTGVYTSMASMLAKWTGRNTKDNLDEGWKEKIAAAGIGAAMTLGGQQALKQYTPATTVQPQQQQQQLSPKDILIRAAKDAGMSGNELAQFLAQAAHETLNFTRMREAGTPEYFTKKYEQHRKTARILGNKVKGDGERYKGRGFIQLTGRDNYTRAGKALGLPLEANPELAAQPDNAAKIAVWYWQNRVAPKVQDFTNTKAVTKKINPAGKHQDRRQQQFAKYQVAQNETA
jgi:putative chitinase